VALALDYCLELNVAVRLGLLAVEVGLMGGGLWWALVRPWSREYSPEALAALVERSHPELKERLVSIVSLCAPDVPEAERGSHLMRDLLVRQTLRSIEEVDFQQSVPGQSQGRWALCGLLAWVLLLAPALVRPTTFGLLVQRFFSPWSNLERAGSIAFEVQPGDATVARGVDVTFTAATADGNAALKPRLEWVDSGGGVESRPMEWDADGQTWRLKVPHVFRGLTYHISAERTRTRDYQLDVADPPAIAALKLVVQPPSYTGQAAEEIDGLIGEAAMLAGSELEWQFTFSKPVASAVFSFTPAPAGDVDPQEVAPRHRQIALGVADDRQSAVSRMTAEESGTFSLRLVDDAGLANSDPDRRILVKPDQSPEISLEGSDEPQEAQPDDVFPIVATTRDDVGVAAVELHLEGPRGLKKMIPFAGPELGRRSVEAGFRLNLSDLALSDGDEVHYRVRAADARETPGPQEAWSEARILRINSKAAPPQTEALAQAQNELERRLADLRSEIAEHHEELELVQWAADASARKNRPFEENDKLPALGEREQTLAQKLEQLAAAFNEHPLFANVSDRIADVGKKELASAQSHVEQATGEPILEKSADLLRAADQIAAAEAKLKGVADDFQKLAELERDLLELNRLGEQTRELSQSTRELSELQDAASPEETSADAAAREQAVESQRAELAQKRADLAQRLNDLLERRPELVRAAQQAELDQVAELGKRAEELAATEEQLARTQQQEARQAAEKAAPVAQSQDELAGKAEAAAKSEPANNVGASRINPDELRQALDALKQGNLGEAAAAQKQAADRLNQLAADGRKPDAAPDSASAETAKQAAELAKQQEQLRQDLARAQNPPTNPASKSESGKTNAEQQAAKSGAADKQVQELTRAQAKLAQEARKLAQQAAEEYGEQSSAAKRAAEAAANSAQACKECQGGGLAQAAESGRKAATAGENAAREMNFAAGRFDDAKETAQAAAKLAQHQADLASKMEAAARDPAAQTAATGQAQQRVAQSTEQLAQALQQAAERMNRQPLSLPKSGQQAAQAQQAANQAQQALQQAQASRQRQDFARASHSSQQAAKALQESAAQCQGACSQSAASSPVPGSVGKQVGQAATALQNARAALAPRSQSSKGGTGSNPSSQGESQTTSSRNPSEGKSGQGSQSKVDQTGGDQSGQGNSGQSSRGAASASARSGQGQEQTGTAAAQSGQPGGSGNGSGGMGELALGARQLELASQALNAAAQQLQVRGGRPGQGGPRQPADAGSFAEGAAPTDGEPMPLEAEPRASEIVQQLDAEVHKLSGRRWGELPGHLRTEILQSAAKKPNGDYAGLIKAYFKEIARPQRQTRSEGRSP
jgi:DNA repair exonuclease SbcCD ATPase subunit